MVDKWRRFKDPVAISLDAARFDMAVNEDLLKIEHMCYCMLASKADRTWLRSLLRKQLRNRCYARDMQAEDLVKWLVFGNRMSGDMNTALGNCLLMCLMAMYAMELLGIRRYALLDDGDDIIVIVERCYLDAVVKHSPKIFEGFGMQLKVENVATKLYEVDWCQSRLMQHSQRGWIFIANWKKILTTSASGVGGQWLDDPRKVLGSVGLCLLSLYRGVPIIQNYALALIRHSEGKYLQDFSVLDLYHRAKVQYNVKDYASFIERITKVKPMPITSNDRAAFFAAWDVYPPVQEDIERKVDAWEWNYTGKPEEPLNPEWSFGWNWNPHPGFVPGLWDSPYMLGDS